MWGIVRYTMAKVVSSHISDYKWSRADIVGAQANVKPQRIESTPACVSQAPFSSGPVSSSIGAPDGQVPAFSSSVRLIPVTIAS